MIMTQAKLKQAKDSRKGILLVDNHVVVRLGIARLINQQSDLTVRGEEADATHALRARDRLKPGFYSPPSAGNPRGRTPRFCRDHNLVPCLDCRIFGQGYTGQ
jgi:hypothetical protein